MTTDETAPSGNSNGQGTETPIAEAPAFGAGQAPAWAGWAVTHCRLRPYFSLAPATPVREAVRQMTRAGTRCVLIVEDRRLRGLLTVRDVLGRLGGDLKAAGRCPVAQVMVRRPVWVRADSPLNAALHMMMSHDISHLPVLDALHQVQGLIDPQRISECLDLSDGSGSAGRPSDRM